MTTPEDRTEATTRAEAASTGEAQDVSPARARQRRLLRLAVPPAASLAIHLALLAGVAAISITATTIEFEPTERPALAEVDLAPPAAPPLPTPTEMPGDDPVITASGEPQTTLPEPEPVVMESMVAANGAIELPEEDAPAASAGASTARLLATASPEPVHASFAGVQAQAARRIVYVVDASGSVVTTFSFIRDRLVRSIDRLGPNQRFAVVFFRSKGQTPDLVEFGTDVSGRAALVRATPEARALAGDWIDEVRPAGRSDPLAGLRRAMELEPDLVFLLAAPIERTHANWGDGREAIIDELDRLNPADDRTGQRPVVIKTIAFLRADPTGLLGGIAVRHGDGAGSHRVLPLDQLSSDDPEELTQLRVDTSDEGVEAALVAAGDALARADERGAARACLFGLPLPDQRDAVRSAGEMALARLDPERAADPALLAGDPRAALVRARATLLLRSISDEPANPRDTEAGEALARTVAETGELSDPEAEMARLSTLVSAYVQAGDARSLDEALRACEAWAELAERGPDSERSVARAEALAAMVVCDPASFSSRSAELRSHLRLTGLDRDARWQLLLAGVEARALAGTTAGSSEAHPSGPILALDAAALGVAERTAREIRIEMLARLDAVTERAGRGLDWGAAPAEATLLYAVHLGRSRETRARAMRLLDAMARGEGATGDPQADALWEAAALRRLDASETNDARAAADLTRLATQFPGHPRAGEAAVAAVRLDRRPLRERTDEAFVRLMRLAIEADPDAPEADRWRYELAPLVGAGERFELITAMQTGTRDARDAAALLATTADTLLSQNDDDAVRRLILEETVLFLRAGRSGETPRFAHELGVALLAAGEAGDDPELARAQAERAIGLLALSIAGTAEGTRAHWSRTLDLARAEHRVGRTTEAFARVREVAMGAAEGDEAFWPAWTLLLEIAADAGDENARRDALAHLARLRLIDRELGGGEYASRLAGVEASLTDRD